MPTRQAGLRQAPAAPTSIPRSRSVVVKSLISIAEKVIVDSILMQLALAGTPGAEGIGGVWQFGAGFDEGIVPTVTTHVS